MRASSFRYLVKNGVKNLWNNRMMTIASVGTLIACLLIVGFAVLFSINVDSIVEYMGQQNEIVVFMALDTPDEYMSVMKDDLASLDGLGEITYVSRDEAFAEYKEKLGDKADILEGMEDNHYLPASFRAKISSPEKVDILLASIRRMDYVDDVQAPTDLAKTLVSVRRMVNTLGGAVILALVIVSLVIITNTIRASVFNRRKEINIMKYVGATNTFIRIPFLVEGVLLGIIAAVVAYFAIWGGYTVFIHAMTTESTSWLASITQHIVPFKDISYQLMGGFLLAGVLTGGIGSTFSMRGHLKV
ncbi:MAG: permease-like cell division protein FtsX [Candidatus Merdivicinus sp.]|jgi:cell division transport system permease protein